MTSKLEPKKSLGQHWLTDLETLQSIVQAAEVTSADTVLEIGPGPGSLTSLLVDKAANVVAVEFDEQLAKELPKAVKADNLEVINQDILDFDYGQLPANFKVVANIPYYLTSHLIRKLLESSNSPEIIVLLIQKEVAQRIVSQPGQMSILSVAAQYYAKCSLGPIVEAGLFDPPPKVDSQVVIMRKKQLHKIDTKHLFRVVKAGFGEKRKKLANSLSGGLHQDKSKIEDILLELEFGGNVRAQELSVADWIRLSERLEHVG